MYGLFSVWPFENLAGNVIEGCMQLNPRNLLSNFFFFGPQFCLFVTLYEAQQRTPKVEAEIQNPKLPKHSD